MKNMNKKSITLLIAVVALVLVTVGGTLAYLIDSTDPVTNTFTPSQVKTEIDEEFDGSAKSEIIIKNADSSIKVYVRVALVGNWVKNGEIVEAWTPNFDLGENWTQKGGFYYYKKALEPGESTTDLLKTSITASTTGDKTLEVTVIHQAIQAEPETTVESAWGVTVTDGVIQ